MKPRQKLTVVPDVVPATDIAEPPVVQSAVPFGVKTGTSEDGKPVIGIPDSPNKNVFQSFGGSENHYFNSHMLRSVLGCMQPFETKGDDKAAERLVAAAAAMLKAFKPTDEIEGMLAAQAAALHFSAMECLRRAMIVEQPFEIATKLRRDGANLARGVTDMLEALDRKRGKGPQVVRVERVIVNEGGQAMVGNVTGGGGG